jgi:ribonuclease D
VQHDLITTDRQLAQLCERLADAPSIGFDTEFVSEHSYRPRLCLVQVAAGDALAVIDPLLIDDMTPFWRLLSTGSHETVVHAGREEILFCQRAVGAAPANLVDLQLTAGLVGPEYPAGYGSLLSRWLGAKLDKHETRTDWSKRPLNKRQLQYALDDVIYLEPLKQTLFAKLDELGRFDWLAGEIESWQNDVAASVSDERWRRVSGASNLAPRSLAVVREIWRWRENEAERRDSPVRRVLRDDLIVELAKRQSSDVERIRTIRGLDRRDLQNMTAQLAACVARATALSDDECPESPRRDPPAQLNMIAQLLSSILTSICRKNEAAVGLVGTVQDVRELVAHRMKIKGYEDPPRLARGWRATIVGEKINRLLAGEATIRIADPLSDHPLEIEAAE